MTRVQALDESESLPSNLLFDETTSHSPFAAAARSLSAAQKIELLDNLKSLPEKTTVEDLLTLTIGHDTSLYPELLNREYLAAYHLAPLRGRPNSAWADLAILALERGFSAEEIVDKAFSVPWTTAGSGVSYWESWKADFELLRSNARPDIREIGRLGSERGQQRAREADEDWREQHRVELRRLVEPPA